MCQALFREQVKDYAEFFALFLWWVWGTRDVCLHFTRSEKGVPLLLISPVKKIYAYFEKIDCICLKNGV